MRKVGLVAVLTLSLSGFALAENVTGWVTDAACAGKGKFGAEHKGCAQKCVGKGQAAVLVTEDKKVYKIHNQDAVKDHVGDKVTAMGKVDGDSIHVDSVTAAN